MICTNMSYQRCLTPHICLPNYVQEHFMYFCQMVCLRISLAPVSDTAAWLHTVLRSYLWQLSHDVVLVVVVVVVVSMGSRRRGSKAKSLLKDTVVSLFYQQTGHFSMCWIRCNFPICFMAISDPRALVSKLLGTDIISNIRRTLAILRALKGPSLHSVMWMA